MIKQVRCQWSYSPCTPEEVSDDPAMREVLAGYARRHTNASMLIPVGGISLMQNAQKMTGGRCVFLIGKWCAWLWTNLWCCRHPPATPRMPLDPTVHKAVVCFWTSNCRVPMFIVAAVRFPPVVLI